jgi:hypothetical protein
MTGRRYYITTLADWHRHAHRLATSHWLALDVVASNINDDADPAFDSCDDSTVGARPAAAGEHHKDVPGRADATAAPSSRELADASCAVRADSANPVAHDAQPSDETRILVLIDADEGVHLALEDDAAFEALPHPFAPKAISDAAQQALAPHGVAPGATTFDAAEAAARAHPLLRPRVF